MRSGELTYKDNIFNNKVMRTSYFRFSDKSKASPQYKLFSFIVCQRRRNMILFFLIYKKLNFWSHQIQLLTRMLKSSFNTFWQVVSGPLLENIQAQGSHHTINWISSQPVKYVKNSSLHVKKNYLYNYWFWFCTLLVHGLSLIYSLLHFKAL